MRVKVVFFFQTQYPTFLHFLVIITTNSNCGHKVAKNWRTETDKVAFSTCFVDGRGDADCLGLPTLVVKFLLEENKD